MSNTTDENGFRAGDTVRVRVGRAADKAIVVGARIVDRVSADESGMVMTSYYNLEAIEGLTHTWTENHGEGILHKRFTIKVGDRFCFTPSEITKA